MDLKDLKDNFDAIENIALYIRPQLIQLLGILSPSRR